MPNPEKVPHATDAMGSLDDPMEAQLQQELRSMFEVDTQKGLQAYLDQASCLRPQTWSNDIQTLYRAIHTIKGGAVTVRADAILHVATVLEDLLSDLRHLEMAPPLEDGQLEEILVEAGELLASTIPIEATGESAQVQVESSVGRIQTLRSHVQERYLPQWSQQKQFQQEFAQQGLDLVVLGIEIGLEKLPQDATKLPENLFHTARSITGQLYQIGRDLELSSGWVELLQKAEILMIELRPEIWRTQWPRLFQALKNCVRSGGESVPFTLNLSGVEAESDAGAHSQEASDTNITGDNLAIAPTDSDVIADSEADITDVFTDMGSFLDDLGSLEETLAAVDQDVAIPAMPQATADAETPVTSEDEQQLIDDPETLAAIDRAISAAAQSVPLVNTEDAASDESLVAANPDTIDGTIPTSEADQTISTSEADQESSEILPETTPAESQLADDAAAARTAAEPDISVANAEQETSENTALVDSNGAGSVADAPLEQSEILAVNTAFEAQSQAANLEALAALDEENLPAPPPPETEKANADSDTWLINLLADALDTDTEVEAVEPVTPSEAKTGTLASTTELTEQIQIPVPLERLDQSARDLVNALLSVRSTQGIYKVLQTQILQLSSLAQEGVQHITRLRQIQDDYALVDNLQLNLRQSGPTPERYRQGYVTINRLLETSLRLSELGAETEKSAKQMTESLQFLDSNILKLQATVEESRLVPFRNLAFRARAILRDLATRFSKPAKLVIQGERTELDVGSARSLEPALLHLIRNAFDHALESQEERQTLGKSPQGTLTLSLQRLGNLYRLNVQDDGRGMDAQAIHNRALELALPLNDTSTPANLLAVICQPGFSSETEVSNISGRGVGMDVVAAQMAKLGGKLTLETTLGAGTTFSLQFPVPHLLVSCMLLQAGDRIFAVPVEDIRNAALLESLQAIASKEPESAYSWEIETADKTIPGLDLLEYWQPQLSNRSFEETAVCTYIQSSVTEQGVWLIADELLGQSDLLINSLPAPLKPPEGMLGISLQPDGTLVPVLNATAIIEWLHTAPSKPVAEASDSSESIPPETANSPSTPTILIVDDAALMRRRIEASLSSYGHITHTCSDGLDAWNWLKVNPLPALIITDIEMPNMDGFTLIDRCRQENLSMPILVVSSRLSEDWFTEARRLGATDYLTKGFSTLDLITKVTQLVSSET
ncbi:MAG: response regulator [Cyanobacteria bacterium P01_F01_bin.86]